VLHADISSAVNEGSKLHKVTPYCPRVLLYVHLLQSAGFSSNSNGNYYSNGIEDEYGRGM
jgi:hypothetical protein